MPQLNIKVFIKIWDEYQVYSNDEMEHADDTIKMLNPEQEDQKT